MLSRVFPLIRICNSASKFAAPVNNSNLQLFRYTVVNQFNCQKMSTVSDDVLNEAARNLDYSQLLEKKKDPKTVLIDVREHSEINETGKLPGSIHIPLNELGQALGGMSPGDFETKYSATQPGKDKNVIFSCKAGGRSRKAMAQAYTLGYLNAAHYKGGWLDWAENTKKN